jgi:N6-L-threonylcarbamoyladenine synthase
MNVLTIETTCDETAAAVVTDELAVLGSALASQNALHQRFGGVVPEIASRAHVEAILPVIDQALSVAGLRLDEIHAVAVANTPGLAGSLLVGLAAAKALAVALEIPLVAVNHLQAHIYACRIAAGLEIFPCVGLIASGGHSSLYRCAGPLDFTLLGGTIDDAAGEAFDKVAAMLGLPYPGGPAIEATARGGNPKAFAFPRAFLRDETRLDFSFSGLKTAVLRFVREREQHGAGAMSEKEVADICASFQRTVVTTLVDRAFDAARRFGAKSIGVAGGVSANSRLRADIVYHGDQREMPTFLPSLALSTDNAAMIAAAGLRRLRAGVLAPADLNADPALPL